MNFNNLSTYGLQYIPNQISNINNIHKLRLITDSNNCKIFENKISKLVNCKYTVVCNSGTSALMMSLLSLKYKKITAIVPNINFVAVINILKFLDANIVISDVNDRGMTDYSNFKKCLAFCKKKNLKPNVFLPIHYAGFILDLSKINKICKKNKISIIEDGCHSFGSMDPKKNYVGNSINSDMTTFSFHPVKNITTIEGGAVCTNNKKIYKKLCQIKSFDLKKTNLSDPYNAEGWGLNFRMGEVNAILGIDQIKNIQKFKKKRIFIIKKYKDYFTDFHDYLEILNTYEKIFFWHLCVIKLKGKLLKNKVKFMKYLKTKGIATQIHYKPITLHKFYKKHLKFGEQTSSLTFYNQQLTFPLHYRMTSSDVKYIVKTIRNFINNKI